MEFKKRLAIIAISMAALMVMGLVITDPALATSPDLKNKGTSFGIIVGQNNVLQLSPSNPSHIGQGRITNARSVLPWPVVKSVSPNPAKSGQTNVMFDVYIEYPFAGTTANVADTLPAGWVLTGPFTLDGQAITPSIATSSFVEFDNIPSPSVFTTGVRHLTFHATAPVVTSITRDTDRAIVQFFDLGVPVGPTFYYTLTVTTTP